MKESPELAELLARIAPPQSIDLSLERMHAALAAFDNPHLRLPPVVHVAGTNGKGSTIAFVRAMLEAAGKSCHVYTSPHLVHFRERIVLSGEEISDEALCHYLRLILDKNLALTFFEVGTLAAFLAFADAPADIVLLEVGMGGRLDATNVLPQPALTIITPVALDHKEYLGDTLAAIATEKAGIIKPGVQTIVAPQEAEAMEVIRRIAQQQASPLIEVTKGDITHVPQQLSLAGVHQRINAATAMAAARALGLAESAIASGLASARWPARLQLLEAGPLAALLPKGWTLYLDGGHNPAAAEALADWAASHQPLHVICSMTAHKDAAAFLTTLAGVADSIHLIEIPDEPMAMTQADLCCAAAGANVTATAHPSVVAALRAILEANTQESGYILICGSLYLAGHVLAMQP